MFLIINRNKKLTNIIFNEKKQSLLLPLCGHLRGKYERMHSWESEPAIKPSRRVLPVISGSAIFMSLVIDERLII